MTIPYPQRTIVCYHCRARFLAAARAMSLSCPRCSKRLLVDDVIVKTMHAVRTIQTCGKLIVTAKGHVSAQKIEALGGLEVEGTLEADVHTGGAVRIGPQAKWYGDCRAPSIAIAEGALITGGYFVIPDDSMVVKEDLLTDILSGPGSGGSNGGGNGGISQSGAKGPSPRG